jgi:hypothetical protein
MDVEKTIEFLLEHQARFEVRMAELTAKMAESSAKMDEWSERFNERMDSMLEYHIGVEERHDREMATIRSELNRAVRASIEEHRRERVRRKALDAKLDKLAASVQQLTDNWNKRNGDSTAQ